MTRGIALSSIMRGSSTSAINGTSAAAKPRTIPSASPIMSPERAAAKVASKWLRIVPSANRENTTRKISLGAGA